MPQQVHLEDGLLGRHGLDGKALVADDLEFFLRLVLSGGIGRHGRTLQRPFPEPFLKAGLVPADLALNGRHTGVHRSIHVVRKFACPVEHTVVTNGDLRQETAPLQTEGDIGIGLALKELVQLANLLHGIGPQVLRRIHPFLGESELHLCQLLSNVPFKSHGLGFYLVLS